MTQPNQSALPQIPRKSTSVPPPASHVAAGLPKPGQFPLTAGTAIRLSPLELAELEKIGWQPGQPIPGNLPDAIEAAARQAVAAADPTGVEGINVAQAIQNITSIDDLHPAAAEALRENMRQMADYHQAMASAPTVPGAPAGVNENIAQLHLQQRASQVQQAKQDAAAMQSTPSVPPVPVQPATVPPPQPTAATPAATSTEPLPTSQTGLYPTYPEICPHCRRKTNEPALALTDSIKRDYVAALCSGSGRYYHTASLLGGQLKIQFRTATEPEVVMCQQQLLADIRNGRVSSAAESTHQITEYLAIANTESIRLGDAMLSIPPLTDVAVTDKVSVFEVVMASITMALPQALLIRAWKRSYDEFQELQNALLAAMANSDF